MNKVRYNFLICSERSGSNLLTRVFDSHSGFSGPSPAHLLRLFLPTLNNYRDDEDNARLIHDVLEAFNLKMGDWNIDLRAQSFEPQHSFKEIYKEIYRREAESQGKQNLLIKEVRTYNLVSYILENFEDPKFVFQVRDPRDMALSWKKSPVHRGDVIRASNIWRTDQEASLIQYFNLKPSNSIELIKYEELISSPRKVLKPICKFLDVEYEESMESFYADKNTRQQATKTDNWKNLDKPLLKDNFNKYKQGLTEEEIKLIEFENDRLMEWFGYEKEFQVVSREEYHNIRKELLKKERHEKEGYQQLPDFEKEKRKKWAQLRNRLDPLNLF